MAPNKMELSFFAIVSVAINCLCVWRVVCVYWCGVIVGVINHNDNDNHNNCFDNNEIIFWIQNDCCLVRQQPKSATNLTSNEIKFFFSSSQMKSENGKKLLWNYIILVLASSTHSPTQPPLHFGKIKKPNSNHFNAYYMGPSNT